MGATKIINVLKEDTFDEIFGIVQNAAAEEVIFILPKNTKLLSREDHYSKLKDEAARSGKSFSVLCSNAKINDAARQHGFAVLASEPSKVGKPVRKEIAEPVAKLAVKTLPQDQDVIDDSADAYTEDVVIPSDEKIGIDEGEDDLDVEKKGMRVIDPDEEDDEKEPGDEEELDEEDEQDQEEAKLPEKEPDDEFADEETPKADFAVAPRRLVPERAQEAEIRLATASKVRRSMDGMVSPGATQEQHIAVARRKERPAPVRIKQEEASDDIAEVWENDHGERSASVWAGIRTKRSGGGANFLSGIGGRSRRLFSRNPFSNAWLPIGAGVLLVAIGAFMYFYPRSADLVVTPIEQNIDTSFQIEISSAVSAVDSIFNKLPGQLFSVEKSVAKEFPATGEKEVAQKARGKITVSNSFGTAAQPLIATTRFQSPDGLIFRTLKSIIVPGAHVTGGKVVPGTIDVEVIADKAGSSYNIAPTTFTIIAFKEKGDLSRYEKITGTSAEAFMQGASGLAKVVTEVDYASAVQETTQELKTAIADALTAQSGGLKIVNASNITIADAQSSVQPDQAADKFTVTIGGNLKVFGYKESDLFELVRQYVEKTAKSVVLQDSLIISVDSPRFSEAKNALTVTVHLSGPSYLPIDKEGVVNNLLGKSEEEIKAYLANLPNITKASVQLHPRWSSMMPKDAAKVEVKINY